MTPQEVRDYIGRQHIQLRILCGEAEHACRDALDSNRADPRAIILKLVRAVSDHIVIEDRVLLPTLREIDCWGAVRADQVAAEHAHQRVKLSALRTLARAGAVDDVVRSTLELIRELLSDMDVEERELLGANILRDDPIVISQSDG